MREPIFLWVLMVPVVLAPELIYFVGTDYEGQIGSRFTFVYKGVLVIIQDCTGVSEPILG